MLFVIARDLTAQDAETVDKCFEVWDRDKDDKTRRERFRGLKSDRTLSDRELACLLKAADSLVDKRVDSGERYFNALFLGDLGHKHGLPALLAVLRDTTDEPSVRLGCIAGLSRISDDRVVDALIDVLTEYDGPADNIAGLANEKLVCVTRTKIPATAEDWNSTKANSPERKQLQDRWRSWWKLYRRRIDPDRANAYSKWPPIRVYEAKDFPLKGET
jgi:hypothetical protein